jgi:hypothetical protein
MEMSPARKLNKKGGGLKKSKSKSKSKKKGNGERNTITGK